MGKRSVFPETCEKPIVAYADPSAGAVVFPPVGDPGSHGRGCGAARQAPPLGGKCCMNKSANSSPSINLTGRSPVL